MRLLLHVCCGPCSLYVLERLLEEGHEITAFFFNPNIQPLAEYLRRREGAGQAAAHFGVPILYGDMLDAKYQNWPERMRFTSLESPEDLFSTPRSLHSSEGITKGFSGKDSGFAANSFSASPNPTLFEQQRDSTLDSIPQGVHPVPWLRCMHGREDKRCPYCWFLRLQTAARYAADKGYEGFSSSLLYSRYQNHELLRRQGEFLASENSLSFVYEDFRLGWQRGIDLSKELNIYRQPYCGCLFSEYARYAKALKKAQQAE